MDEVHDGRSLTYRRLLALANGAAFSLFQERALLHLFEFLSKLLLGVHYNRIIPGDRLVQRLARDQKKRMPSSPVCTSNSSPRSNKTSERLSASAGRYASALAAALHSHCRGSVKVLGGNT